MEEVVEITMGQSPSSKNYTNNSSDHILVQGNADMKNGHVEPRVWTTQITKQAKKGDLILSVRAPVGDIGKTDYDVVIGRGVAAIKGNEYIFQVLIKMKDSGYWTRFSTGSTFESINSSNIRNAQIMIPKDDEQTKIAKVLTFLDNTIQLHERKCEELTLIKKALLQKLFPKEDKIKPEVRYKNFSDAWEQRKLGEVGKTQSGVGFPNKEQGGHQGIPFFKVSDMNNEGNEFEMKISNNYVTEIQITNRKWKPISGVPAVIFAKVGAALMLNRKRLVKVPFLIDNNAMAYIFNKKWDPYFGKILFDTLNLPRYAQIGALPSFNGSDIEKIKVMLPSLEEQQTLSQFFQNINSLIALHQRKLEKLKQLKKFLLQNMFI